MSVHGEFERYARALVKVLRATGDPHRIAEADEIEGLALAPETSLSVRAAALLDDGLPADASARACWPPEAAEVLDPLIHITHIILGR